LLYAFGPDFELHAPARQWLLTTANSSELVLLPDVVLSGSIRIVTGGKAVAVPEPLESAIGFCNRLLAAPACLLAHPGDRHWGLFTNPCRQSNAVGNLVTDAYLAAIALENDPEMISCDGDFHRFSGLRYRHSLEGS
jgi:toxin-antitoxin system PIN domain toxin